MSKFDFSGFESSSASGLDHFLAKNPAMVTPKSSRVRVASVKDLNGFKRLSAESLVHMSSQDLWAIRRTDDGGMLIERLFDDNGDPLKG